jgi:peptidoglycan/LPS O-acetylase OafA/YrhL
VLGTLITAAYITACALALAALGFVLVEEPCNRLSRKLAPAQTQSPNPPAQKQSPNPADARAPLLP